MTTHSLHLTNAGDAQNSLAKERSQGLEGTAKPPAAQPYPGQQETLRYHHPACSQGKGTSGEQAAESLAKAAS